MVASPRRCRSQGRPLELTLSTCPRLYVIADAEACAAAGWPLAGFIASCLEGGATMIQVRAKAMGGQELLEATHAAVDLARPCGALVIVNDRGDVARAAGADGVHVGQEDLPPSAVRRVVGDTAIVGLSTHSPEQLQRALQLPISYAAMGPVFGTATKATGYDARGLDAIRAAAAHTAARGMPLVAIGGITLERAVSVIDAGAQSVAVISDLFNGGRPDARVRSFLHALR